MHELITNIEETNKLIADYSYTVREIEDNLLPIFRSVYRLVEAGRNDEDISEELALYGCPKEVDGCDKAVTSEAVRMLTSDAEILRLPEEYRVVRFYYHLVEGIYARISMSSIGAPSVTYSPDGNFFEDGKEAVTRFIDESILRCRDRPEIPIADLWNSVSKLGSAAKGKWKDEMERNTPSDPLPNFPTRFPADAVESMVFEILGVRKILDERNSNRTVTGDYPALPQPLIAANTYARGLLLLTRELRRLAEQCRTQRANLEETLELLNAERERVTGRLGRRTEDEREGMPDRGEEGGRQ